MEMQEADLVAAWWNELTVDFQTEILAWLPVEFVIRYGIVCKDWNELLSSSYFIKRWAEAPINRKQPRLLLYAISPTMPSMAFCFYRRTWIESCFTLPRAMQDWVYGSNALILVLRYSVAGLLMVKSSFHFNEPTLRVYNPYTGKFADISRSNPCSQVHCLVVNENNNWRSDDTAFKVVEVGEPSRDVMGSLVVKIFEPSQKRWNIAGYIPEDVVTDIGPQLVFLNGYFYSQWRTTRGGRPYGIVRFAIPLERYDSAATPIPSLLAPYPEIVRNVDAFDDDDDFEDAYDEIVSWPRIITCGSRLLIVAAMKLPVQAIEGEKEVVVIIWEFQIEEDRPANTPSWKWVEVARMTPLVCTELMNKIWVGVEWSWMYRRRYDSQIYFLSSCIGVGDYVCFLPTPFCDSSPVVEVLAYNLIDNTWNWLPSCPCIAENIIAHNYIGTAFEPSPHMRVE